MQPMAMIVHALKLFFSTGFVSAAALQLAATLARAMDARGYPVTWPSFLANQDSVLVVCTVLAATVTLAIEIRRRRNSRSHTA